MRNETKKIYTAAAELETVLNGFTRNANWYAGRDREALRYDSAEAAMRALDARIAGSTAKLDQAASGTVTRAARRRISEAKAYAAKRRGELAAWVASQY